MLKKRKNIGCFWELLLILCFVIVIIIKFDVIKSKIYNWINPPFNRNMAITLGNELTSYNIFVFNPFRYKGDNTEINDTIIPFDELKKANIVNIENFSITTDKIEYFASLMKKNEILVFWSNDSTYFYIMGGWIDDSWGYFYYMKPLDSSSLNAVILENQIYGVEKINDTSNWYMFKQ